METLSEWSSESIYETSLLFDLDSSLLDTQVSNLQFLKSELEKLLSTSRLSVAVLQIDNEAEREQPQKKYSCQKFWMKGIRWLTYGIEKLFQKCFNRSKCYQSDCIRVINKKNIIDIIIVAGTTAVNVWFGASSKVLTIILTSANVILADLREQENFDRLEKYSSQDTTGNKLVKILLIANNIIIPLCEFGFLTLYIKGYESVTWISSVAVGFATALPMSARKFSIWILKKCTSYVPAEEVVEKAAKKQYKELKRAVIQLEKFKQLAKSGIDLASDQTARIEDLEAEMEELKEQLKTLNAQIKNYKRQLAQKSTDNSTNSEEEIKKDNERSDTKSNSEIENNSKIVDNRDIENTPSVKSVIKFGLFAPENNQEEDEGISAENQQQMREFQ